MIQLFLQPNDIPALTGFSGNIDIDSIKPSINVAQQVYLKRILGTDLYNYISSNIDTLSGDYLTIYNDYVVYMTAFFAAATYLALNTSKVSNAGTFKLGVDGATATPNSENNTLGKNYESIAIGYETNFYEFMKTISIPEYGQTETNKTTTNLIQWY